MEGLDHTMIRQDRFAKELKNQQEMLSQACDTLNVLVGQGYFLPVFVQILFGRVQFQTCLLQVCCFLFIDSKYGNLYASSPKLWGPTWKSLGNP